MKAFLEYHIIKNGGYSFPQARSQHDLDSLRDKTESEEAKTM